MADSNGYVVDFGGYTDALPGHPDADDHMDEVQLQAREPLLHQRVYDVGGSQWVYYTKSVSDPTPLAAETTPNHTGGSLTNHSILLKIFD